MNIEELSPIPQISKRRSSIIYAVVERPDHHCDDDLVIVGQQRLGKGVVTPITSIRCWKVTDLKPSTLFQLNKPAVLID